MSAETLISVGKVLKTFGNKGDLTLRLHRREIPLPDHLPHLFLSLDGENVPFFVLSFEIKSDDTAIIRLEDMNDPESAAPLRGAEVLLPRQWLPEAPEDEYYSHEIIGFSVVDDTFGEIGLVTELMELPQQFLLRVMQGEKEILIPAVSGIIRKVDKKKRTIRINAPEGLIAMYL
jgi:16S rRNA processing protein RimM